MTRRRLIWTIARIVIVVALGVLGFGRLRALGSLAAGEHRPARDRYNEGVAALVKGDYGAAEKALLDARSNAGVDPELRFRAAYDLGFALASHADQKRIGKDADLTAALDLAQQAVSWLTDASRLRPDHADTRANLAIARAKVQAISDELLKGEGKLEVRLDRLIGEQREVLDEARGAWLAIKETGGSDPLAQQGTLTHLADRERGIVAEAGVVGDLAADEIDAIGKKPEDKRSEQEKVRVIQLKNLDHYLMAGRTRITEARRKLQELAAEDGVGRSEAALVALKRAREQLLDPIMVMKLIAQDELAVLQDTAHADTRALELAPAAGADKDSKDGKDGKDSKDSKPARPPAVLPGWLEPPVIAERQGSIRDRLEEVRARLQAAAADAPAPAPAAGSPAAAPNPTGSTASGSTASGSTTSGSTASGSTASGSTAAPAPAAGSGAGSAVLLTPNRSAPSSAAAPAPASPAAAPPSPEEAQRAKLLERVRAALPAVGEATTAMDRARQALADKQVKQALDHEQAALAALARAIEQFSDLKQLVELAYAEHQALLQLLSPEAAKQLDAATRSRQAHELLSQNQGRMPRIHDLIADELTRLDEQARQVEAKAAAAGLGAGSGAGSAAGSGAGSGTGSATGSGAGSATGSGAGSAQDPKQAEAQNQVEQARQQLDQARQQMTQADELRGQAQTALAALDKALSGTADPMPPARDADAKLTELRKLFFSVIEHLQELIRDQGETRDQTSAASGEDDFTRGPKLPGLITRQDGHAQLAKAITEALARQADAAAKQPAQGQAQGQGPNPRSLAAAADEVRQSQGDMADAGTNLVKARDSKTTTESLAPGVKSQGKALEHLENALKLLQPPQKNNQNDKDQQQQQQQQQQQKQKQDQQPQQGGAGQRARDEDARRQRERRDRDAQSDPVEKDW
ncbi:MAG TPA: hypothetical protein VHT91_05630 [Kofleriaceae bacterium]|jgi:hypothetical protein|nr:hypothetical protein [Kofleriaceae bacterium]